jgi:hypothetical protein
MNALRNAALILCTALAGPLVGSPTALADPSTPLSGFGDFSGAQTQLGFDDLGLLNGDLVDSVGDVGLSLSSGGGAPYFEDGFARESGIEGFGSLSNWWNIPRPFPELIVQFASPIHRVGFEARVNPVDQVVVTLLAEGTQVDQVAFASRGSDALYFYGLENAGGFDEVRIDALEGTSTSGAFTVDNVTFESLDVTPPDPPEDPEDPPTEEPAAVVSCDGFESFPRVGRGHHGRPHVRALLAQLRDAEGMPLTADDLESPPSLRVWFSPDSGEASVDVTERVVWRGDPELRFFGHRLQRWFAMVMPRRMDGYGTYMAMLESGDPSAYTLDPTCADWTVNERPKRKHKHKHHGHGRRDRDDD